MMKISKKILYVVGSKRLIGSLIKLQRKITNNNTWLPPSITLETISLNHSNNETSVKPLPCSFNYLIYKNVNLKAALNMAHAKSLNNL
jgi:hypothetical protein